MRFSQILLNFGFVQQNSVEHTIPYTKIPYTTWSDDYNKEPEVILARVMATLEKLNEQS